DYDGKAYHYLNALGGPDNIQTLDYCATRLRLHIKDMEQVDEKSLKRQGENGIMKISKKNLQVIVGTTVEFLATAMRKRMDAGDMEAPSGSEVSNKPETAPQVTKSGSENFIMPVKGRLMNM